MASIEALLDSAAQSGASAYAIDSDFRIVAVNDVFWRFADQNGGAELRIELGKTSVVDAISGDLRDFYARAYRRALVENTRWEHEYECSSARLYRRFRLVAYPLHGRHLVLVHALHVELAHPLRGAPADENTYCIDGYIRMCSHCRRVRNARVRARWDWVPAYVERSPLNVSHGLCGPCATYYWPH